ncbi:MAG: retropepsin-like domain-containing protein [Bacteroidaceae bacterium]|nr:retropepsin-like domain-containing protein [Bacteroidaceae bacterium]
MRPYTKEYKAQVKAIITEAYVFPNFKKDSLPTMKYFTPIAAWDTGAENTYISPRVAEALELTPIGNTKVMALGGSRDVDIYEIALALPNGRLYHDYKVYCDDIDDYDVLLGMDIIGETDFLITNKDRQTTFSFRSPSEGNVSL